MADEWDESLSRMMADEFRAGKQVQPEFIVTARDAEIYWQEQYASVAARNKYLEQDLSMQRQCNKDMEGEKNRATKAIVPYIVYGICASLVAIAGFIAGDINVAIAEVSTAVVLSILASIVAYAWRTK